MQNDCRRRRCLNGRKGRQAQGPLRRDPRARHPQAVDVWGDSFDGAVSPARTSIDQPGSALAHDTASPSPASTTATRARTRVRAVDAGCDSNQREEDVPLQRAHREHRRVPKLLPDDGSRFSAHIPRAPNTPFTPTGWSPRRHREMFIKDRDTTFISGVASVSP
ncbi:hypothetical protein HWV62_27456 [Athelia sp. TMB]|nr:hypothetical protein HWV62_27456 [Athelia sp. TMB]